MNRLSLLIRGSWLVLVAGMVVAGILFIGAGSAAAAPPPPQPPGEYQGPEYCGECHVDRHQRWSLGAHANAFENPEFQAKWDETGNDPECLACHMSGFDPGTGEYAQEAVTCEGCHGPLAEGHPDAAVMDVTRVEFLCDSCHKTSHHEWRESRHAQVDVTCNSCHFLCTLETRAQDGNAVCINCHEGYQEDEAHVSHASEQFDCLDCHMRFDPYQETPDGLIFTAHSFVANASDCVSCHTSVPHSGDTSESLNTHTAKLGCPSCHTPPGGEEASLTMRDIMASPDSFACEDCHTTNGGKVDFVAMGYTEQEVQQLAWADYPPITAEQASILTSTPKKGWGWLVWIVVFGAIFVIFDLTVARRLRNK